MNLELNVDEASILYSAVVAFADELRNMRGRTAAMSSLAEQLEEKERICYELSQRIAGLSEGN